jgi:hypothetical protein
MLRLPMCEVEPTYLGQGGGGEFESQSRKMLGCSMLFPRGHGFLGCRCGVGVSCAWKCVCVCLCVSLVVCVCVCLYVLVEMRMSCPLMSMACRIGLDKAEGFMTEGRSTFVRFMQ